jgi:hypothetical protein
MEPMGGPQTTQGDWVTKMINWRGGGEGMVPDPLSYGADDELIQKIILALYGGAESGGAMSYQNALDEQRRRLNKKPAVPTPGPGPNDIQQGVININERETAEDAYKRMMGGG